MHALWERIRDDQRGQLIAIAMAILGVGVAVVVPALAYVGSSLRSVDGSTGHAEQLYAAEAMAEAVIADLRQGVDVLDLEYTPPFLTLNGYTPAVSINQAVIPFPRIRVFADPGTTTHMAPLAPGESFIYVVEGVEADTEIEFNWNYTPTNPSGGPDTRIEVFEGISTDTDDRIRNNTDNNSPHQHTLGSGVNDGGTFTFRFTNESGVPITSGPFGDEGQPGLTWMSLVAGADYIVTAEAGTTVVQAYLQVGPGGSDGGERSVAVLAWLEPQDFFSDLQNGGTTSGWVLDSDGLNVALTDLADPTGFQIDVTGGAGTARVVICGFTLLLDNGDSVVGTCGSLTLETLSGDVDVVTDPRITLNVPESTKTTISKTDRNTTVVENFPSSPQTITATVATKNGDGIVTVPSSATVEIVLPPEGGALVIVPPGSAGVTVDIGNGPQNVPPGSEFVLEQPPAPGLRGVKLAAIDRLRLYEDESWRIEDAIEHIEESVRESWWEDESTLYYREGSKVFKEERQAVKDLMKAIDHDDLPSQVETAVEEVIDDLVSVDRALAVQALDLSLASSVADPDDADKVERKQEDAQEQIEEGDDDLEDGRPDKAIDHYRKAWHYIYQALRYQVPPVGEVEEPGNAGEGEEDDVGVRSELYVIVQTLQPIQHQSDDIEDAIEKILQTIPSSYWVAASSLDPQHGDKVFERLEDAADELEDAFDDDDVSFSARGVVLQAARNLVSQARILAYDQLQRSLALPELNDHDDQDDVEDDQEDALDDLEDGDDERDDDDWDKAIDAYSKAWHHATDALDEQGYFENQGNPGDDDNDLGLRGAIEDVIDDLDGFANQSHDIEDAIEKLQASLTQHWWSGISTLDKDDGDDVFDKLEDAVDELDDALDNDDELSHSAESAVEQAALQIVAIARTLANDQLQRSLALPDLSNWHDQRDVERDQEDAMDELDDGDEEAEDGDYDNAIDDYRKAWEHATEALEEQDAL